METMTYAYMLLFGGLLLASRFLEHISEKIKLPSMLLILTMGLLLPDFLGDHQSFLSYEQAESIATVGLSVVLFYGGLTTRWSSMRRVIFSGLRMATVGCVITAGAATALIYGLSNLHGQSEWIPTLTDLSGTRFIADLPLALFLGSMLCSTDATAVLALLRPISSKIPGPLLNLIECESAFNDPVAVILAGVALALAKGQLESPLGILRDVGLEFGVGALVGLAGAYLGTFILGQDRYLKANTGSEVICLSLLMVSCSIAFLCGGSPLLCAYVIGCVIGNSSRIDCVVVSEFAIINRASELILLISLGIVVFPQDVWPLKWYALVVFLITMISRFLMTFTTLYRAPFQTPEKTFTAFVGLRGAVPIAIAFQAAASGVAWGPLMPAFALSVVLYGLILQGYFLPAATDLLAKTLQPQADLSLIEQASLE
jgi:CPA1 family monovalent cation:H+ antiporter/cell volume regulation protein A